VLSDWVDWLTLRPTSLVVLAPYLPWGPAATLMAGTPVTLARTLTTLRITAASATVGRAICGLPLGSTQLAAKGVVMDNLIGDDAHDWPAILSDSANHLHLYGKAAVRPGRKMGHVTRLVL
jgi:hypothetical protein